MSSLDRGSEHHEAAPKTVEQQINEHRAEQAVFRADLANWDKTDPTNIPNRRELRPDPEPITAEERVRTTVGTDAGGPKASHADTVAEHVTEPRKPGDVPASVDKPGDRTDRAVFRDDDTTGPVATNEKPHPPRFTIIFDSHGTLSTTDPSVVDSLPGHYYYASDPDSRKRRSVPGEVEPGDAPHDDGLDPRAEGDSAEPYSDPAEVDAIGLGHRYAIPDSSGDATAPTTYHDAEDVREAFHSGKSVPEVKRELLDQPTDPPSESTTELVRTEGDLDFELGTPDDRIAELDLEDDAGKSKSERVLDAATKRSAIEQADQAGNLHARAYSNYFDTRPIVVEGKPPVAWAPDQPLNGGAVVIAPLVAWTVVHHGLPWIRRTIVERQQPKGADNDARD